MIANVGHSRRSQQTSLPAIPSWAAGQTTAPSSIVVVDLWTEFTTAAGTSAVTFTVSSSAAPGRADLTITGSGGGLSRTAPLPVVVSAAGGGPAMAMATSASS